MSSSTRRGTPPTGECPRSMTRSSGGCNTRRIRGALQPLLKAAPLSKRAVSRVIATLKDGLEAWRTHSLAGRPRCDLRLPRWLRPAGAQWWEGCQRPCVGRRQGPRRREQTAPRPRAVRGGVLSDSAWFGAFRSRLRSLWTQQRCTAALGHTSPPARRSPALPSIQSTGGGGRARQDRRRSPSTPRAVPLVFEGMAAPAETVTQVTTARSFAVRLARVAAPRSTIPQASRRLRQPKCDVYTVPAAM